LRLEVARNREAVRGAHYCAAGPQDQRPEAARTGRMGDRKIFVLPEVPGTQSTDF
jgi:hypothetical protein